MPRKHNRRPTNRKKYTEPNKIPLSELYIRDNGICYYCKNVVETIEEATRDHVTPKHMGGRNGHNFENIVLMHGDCNKLKDGQLIEAA